LYWLSIAAGVALLCFGGADITAPGFPAHLVRNTLLNLTMFQGYLGIPNVIGLYYTLAMEMAFYIVFSLLFIRQLHRRSVRIAWMVSTVIAVFAILIPLIAHRRVPLAGLFYILCLTVGTSIYRNFNGEASNGSLIALLSFIAVSIPVAVYLNYVLIKKDDPLEHYSFWAVLAPWSTAYIVFLISYLLRTHSFPRALVWLGTISYSVYLLHPLVLTVVPAWHNPVYSLIVKIAVTIIVASCTYLCLERPSIALGKRLYAQFMSGPGRASSAVGLTDDTRLDHGSPARSFP
jgi:peptidoglycan/LPS O-acetylase OafA/YrhL